MARAQYLLDLPVEMIEHAFTFVDPLDLSNLRLVSREVGAIVLRQFTAHYLSTLHVCILEPRRIARIKELLSASAFKGSRKALTLTLNVFESESPQNIQLARQLEETDEDARGNAYEDHRSDHFWSRGSRVLDEKDIRKLLLLALKARCDLHVDLRPCTESHIDSRSLIEQAFAILRDAEYPISSLDVAEQYAEQGSLLDVKGNGTFTYLYRLFYDQLCEHDDDEPRDDGTMIKHVLAAACHLRWLALLFRTDRDYRLEAYKISANILLASSLHSVMLLQLRGLVLDPAHLLEALQRCHSTLIYLDLNRVFLAATGDAWTSIIECVRTMPQLLQLSICGVGYSYRSKQNLLEFPVKEREEEEGDELDGIVKRWGWYGQEEIATGLGQELDTGLKFTSCP